MLLDTRGDTGPIDATCPVEWAHPLNQGLVGWWAAPAGYAGGSKLPDLTRLGDASRHGVLTNGPTWVAGPTPGFGALNFDGSDDYASLPVTNLAAGTDVSVVFDATPAATSSGYRACLTNASGSIPGLFHWVDNTWTYYTGGGTISSGAVTAGRRYHVVCTTRQGDANRLYVDGVQAGSGAASWGGVSALSIGWDGINARFNGAVHGAAAYSRALSASDVAALYDQARRGHPDTLRRVRSRAWMFLDAGGGEPAAAASVVGGGVGTYVIGC